MMSFDFWPLILAGNKFASAVKETLLFKSSFRKFCFLDNLQQYLLLIRNISRQNYNHYSHYCYCSYLKKINVCVDLSLRVIFLTFRVDLILQIG